jgi:hypothetical protein
MKSNIYFKILLICFLILNILSTISYGSYIDNNPNNISIDRYLIDIFQHSDLKTFQINQYFYINNSGNSSFNGSFYLWLPNNSIIISDCCSGIQNMACRYDGNDEMWCFYFNKTDDENIYLGYPISNGSKLSYYGQSESFLINIYSLSNNSLGNDFIRINATIGGSNLHREKESFSGEGIHITSNNETIGMIPWMAPYRSFNITTFEQIHIFNNGSDDELIEIKIIDLPKDWGIEIWNSTNRINNISLSPKEHANLTLIIKAPSYLAEILVESTIEVDTTENNSIWLFKNKYLYDTKLIYYQIFTTTPEGLNISNDLNSAHEEAYWYDEYNRYWFLASAEDIKTNNESLISLSLKANMPPNNFSEKFNPYYIILIISIFFIIVVVFLLKKMNFFIEKNSKDTITKSIKKNNTKIEDKDKSNKNEIKIKELEKRKKKIILAIKRVEKEFDDKIINKKDFEHLKGTYKKQAIEILKEIDRLKD